METVVMSKTESNAASATEGGALEIKDTRTGKSYTVPILPPATEGDTAIRAMDLRPIKVNAGRVRLDDLRPGVHEHGVVQERHHVHRRRQGHPALSRLSHRAARREGELPRGGVAAAERRAAHAATVRRVVAPDHVPHVRAREHQDVPAGLPLRRASDVDAVQRRRGAVVVLSVGQEHPGSGGAAHQHRAPARQAPDARGVLLPPREGPALHLSRTTTSATSRTSSRWSHG